jgi:hypothetical protein
VSGVAIMNEPTLAEVKEWLKVTDSYDDVTLQVGLQAALAFQQSALRFPTYTAEDCPDETLIDQAYYTDDLRLAVYLRTARYLARRSSPTGIEGFSEFGPVQIALSDRDVAQLESPYVRQVVA